MDPLLLKTALARVGITITELARRIDEDKGYVGKLVNGKRSCSARVIRNMFYALESTVSYEDLVKFFAARLDSLRLKRGLLTGAEGMEDAPPKRKEKAAKALKKPKKPASASARAAL